LQNGYETTNKQALEKTRSHFFRSFLYSVNKNFYIRLLPIHRECRKLRPTSHCFRFLNGRPNAWTSAHLMRVRWVANFFIRRLMLEAARESDLGTARSADACAFESLDKPHSMRQTMCTQQQRPPHAARWRNGWCAARMWTPTQHRRAMLAAIDHHVANAELPTKKTSAVDLFSGASQLHPGTTSTARRRNSRPLHRSPVAHHYRRKPRRAQEVGPSRLP
jgi:hypothetical protein